MFLNLPHTKLEVFKFSRQLVLACYKFSNQLPVSERFGLIQQIRRAATSVTMNIAEGCSRKSVKERRRFFEISRGSIVEIETIFVISVDLEYSNIKELTPTGELLLACFKMLSSMINQMRES